MEGLVTPQPGFWKDRRVLVTGHTGFKGGWLCLWLQKLGASVTGYALDPPTSPSLFSAACIAEGVSSVIADIRDLPRLRGILADARPEIVIHMAAQSLVRTSYADPVETYSVNVMGTVALLEALRNAGGIRAVVNVTSDKCYENREWVWGYRENDRMGGFDPYSSSKGCAELATAALRNSFFNPARYQEHGVGLASARAGNVIGGGDWAEDRLMPDIARAFSKGAPAVIRRPGAVRPWQHVLEPLSGYLRLAEMLWADGPGYAEGWNFGPEECDAWPVQAVVERVAELWGEGAKWRLDEGVHPHEAAFLKLDCSKAKARLQWRPRWELDHALRKTVEWYKAYQAGDDVRKLALEQIEAYAGAL